MVYLKHFNLKIAPFENTPDPMFFFYSKEHKEALARLEYVVSTKKPLCLITGEYGSGKTLLAYTLQNKLSSKNYQVVYSGNPFLPPDELIHYLMLSLSGGVVRKFLLKKLRHYIFSVRYLKEMFRLGNTL
jgi:type II secretory pathway predicted ATPase ExeA